LRNQKTIQKFRREFEQCAITPQISAGTKIYRFGTAPQGAGSRGDQNRKKNIFYYKHLLSIH
jgi:hypothetical protein